MKYNEVHPDYRNELYLELIETLEEWCVRNGVDIPAVASIGSGIAKLVFKVKPDEQ